MADNWDNDAEEQQRRVINGIAYQIFNIANNKIQKAQQYAGWHEQQLDNISDAIDDITTAAEADLLILRLERYLHTLTGDNND